MPVVLVVDDEPDIRTRMKVILESSGYSVITVANGEEALEQVRRSPPDAILLDLMMPGIDGWGVLVELKAAPGPASEIPVFLVSAAHDRDLQIRGGIEGALGYITKPFDPADLAAALEPVLGPDAPPEPELRRRAQSAALESLARAERGNDPAAPGGPPGSEPRVRLTRLEHAPIHPVAPPAVPEPSPDSLASLTPKQRRLVDELATGTSVATVAREFGTSRSSVYASLRRICRKLGINGTRELLDLVRRHTPSRDR